MGKWRCKSTADRSVVEGVSERDLYMNVHTATNPGGEIRGQVLLNNGGSFTAKLDGSQEMPHGYNDGFRIVDICLKCQWYSVDV